MKIILYNSSAEKNRANKDAYLNKIIELDGTLKTGTSLINPAIILELHDEQLEKIMNTNIPVVDDDGNDVIDDDSNAVTYEYVTKILSANYARIPDFNRYYYITDITAVGRNLWMINMSVDVLMSYYGEIFQLECMVARNQHDFDMYVVDDMMNFRYDKDITINHFTNKTSVTELSTLPSTSWHTAVMSYLTDDAVKWSGSTPELNSLTTITAYASASNVSTQYIVGTTGMIYDLAKTVYKNDMLLSFVKNIMVYPFDVPNFMDTSVKTIKIGSTDYTLTDSFRYPAHYPERIVIADFDMPAGTSFLDYSPYSIYEIYIPYVGMTTLSGESILGKEIKIFYLINYEDGTANAYIYNVNDKIILYSAQCTIGVKVALSSTNALELSNQKTALALNTGINLIGSAITLGGGLMSANPLAVGGAVLKGASTIGNAVSTFNQMYDQGKVGITSAVAGLSADQKPFVRITRSTAVGYDRIYFATKGLPLRKSRKLSDMRGFTMIDDVHIDNIPTATLNELKEIETLLKTGVIL